MTTTYVSGIPIGGARGLALGLNAGEAVTTGTDNVLVGSGAGAAVTTGGTNVCVGTNAGQSGTTGGGNVCLGQGAGNLTGSNSTVVGSGSASGATGSGNLILGSGSAGQLTTGSGNVCVGNGTGGTLTTGCNNVAVGKRDLTSNETYGVYLSSTDGTLRVAWPGVLNPAAASAPVVAPVLALGTAHSLDASVASGAACPTVSLYVPAATNVLTAAWRATSGGAVTAVELMNHRPVSVNTATAITLDDSLSNRFVYLTATANVTITTSTGVSAGAEFEFFNAITGTTVTFAAGANCTLRSLSSKVKLTANGAAVLKCVLSSGGSATFVLVGALE